MDEELSRERLKELYLPPADRFVEVDVPSLRFAMLDGKGSLDGEAGERVVRWLFAAVHPIKRIAKQKTGKNFVEPPLEGLWWADDPDDFVAGRKERMKWRMMIVLPPWADEAMFEEGVREAETRLGTRPEGLRVERYDEGRCVQIMHVGPNEDEAPTIVRLHEEYLPANGLKARRRPHEIYLTDPSRVAPEKRKTVLRQPVEACSG